MVECDQERRLPVVSPVRNSRNADDPKELGTFQNSADAWAKRLQAGSASNLMTRDISRLDTQIALKLFGDWTDRIAAGELPFAKPERPKGIERNVVITTWDWGRT